MTVWTALVTILLLKPAAKQTHELSIENFLTSFFSMSFSTWDYIEAIYHIIIFVVLTALWYWALSIYISRNRILFVVIAIVVPFGLATEIGQYFVFRSSLMLDAMANFLGVAICVIWLKRLSHSN